MKNVNHEPSLHLPRQRLPEWLKVRLPQGEDYLAVKQLVQQHRLHTVCESARCPNIGECWGRRTATFMILGNLCTRSCGFCDVPTGRPLPLDWDEPRRVAEAIKKLGLRYAVITSVNRDELSDGGAGVWAATVRVVRSALPSCQVEVLTPDFKGNVAALDTVLDARPDVYAHNLETVPRLYKTVRPQANYQQSLAVLRHAKSRGFVTKSSLMLGIGEQAEEIRQSLRDLVAVGVDIVTLGQYLRPSAWHLPVDRFVPPAEFTAWKAEGEALGIGHVEAGPLVRSSYRADQQRQQLGS